MHLVTNKIYLYMSNIKLERYQFSTNTNVFNIKIELHMLELRILYFLFTCIFINILLYLYQEYIVTGTKNYYREKRFSFEKNKMQRRRWLQNF